jgi:hypothetical protein
MRIRRNVWALLMLSALMAPAAGSAQKFQAPTKEELQMTSDPKAPGASAVFLNREQTTDNRFHFVSGYARIKILTELGKEWATVEIPYVHGFSAEPVIEGRTIHSDGTVIPLTGKASDLLLFQSHQNHIKAAVFNMPSVEVGSILEYKWTIPLTGGKVAAADDGESDDYWSSALADNTPRWEVQQEIFVHKEHFYFNPFSEYETDVNGEHDSVTYIVDGEQASYLLYTQRLPPGAQVSKSPKGDYTLDLRDVPPIRREAAAPPENSSVYQVGFYYTPYAVAADYWGNEGKRWASQLDSYAEQTRTIKDAAQQLITGADAPEARARKIYDAVQALDNTDFSRVRSEEERKQLHLKKTRKKAQDAWTEKSGSSNDMASLYMALARAAGLEVYGVQVVDRSKRVFDNTYLSLHQLDALIIDLRLDGKDIFLDPGEKFCPFGQLHWAHTLAGGLAENVKGPIFTPQNMSKDGITARSADLTLDTTGALTGTVKILMNGPEALRWRQLNLTTDGDEVKKEFNESLRSLLPEGVTGEIDHFQGLDSYATSLLVVVKVSGPLGTTTGKRMLLPGFFFSTRAHGQFVSTEKREAAVDLHYAEQVIDDTVYHLPSGFSVESAPSAAQMAWPEHAALVVKTSPTPGTIDIKHIFARAFVLLEPKDYPALHDYYQKVSTTNQEQLVLASGGVATGN